MPPQVDLPRLEREILQRWEADKVFTRSLEASAGRPQWNFYEGPPTANGRPGTHHIEARAFKDVFPRFKTMQGWHVPRRAGWDCHGLPVEIAVEQELGIAGGRTPLAGRTPEYFGEDPVLSGLLGAAGARGIEDENPVLANLKHYTANEQELDRQTSSSNMDERTFRQIYDLPFAIAVERGNAESVMCSFNQINHVYACENPVLNEALKDD